MPLLTRRLQTVISLAQSGSTGQQQAKNFSGTSSDTATLSGFRTLASVAHAGGAMGTTASIIIYGMTKSKMNQLSTLGMQINLVPKNRIVLSAGDDENNLSQVFDGFIISAYADYNAQPEVPFLIQASCAIPYSVISTPASSFKGSADVATIMQTLANKMGIPFENSGVQVKLNNPYYSGSAEVQMRACAKEAGINANIINRVLCIWPKNGSRNGQVPLVSPATGMIGYPSYTANGILLKTLYNPSINFGNKIKVESDLPAANGEWAIYSIDHRLESEVPGGKWESSIGAYNPKFSPPVAR